jgi:hypothetical protein
VIPAAAADEIGSEPSPPHFKSVVSSKSKKVAIPSDVTGLQGYANWLKNCAGRIKRVPHELAYKCATPVDVITGASINAPAATYVVSHRIQSHA